MADPFATSPSESVNHAASKQEFASVMELLGAEPESTQSAMATIQGPDIPALREQLAILVSTGKAKEAIGVQLTYEQVKRLTDKEVEKYFKRYEAYVGNKTTDSLIDSFIFLVTKVVGMAVNIKDVKDYQKELKNDYIISKELSTLAGSLALKCGRFLAIANAALITTKHIDLNDVPPIAAHTHTKEVQNQVTSTTPATKPVKNPKRVAAGKLVAEKTKQAREAQKKAAIEAAAIIAKENENKSASAKRSVTPPVAPALTEAPPESSGLSTDQWITLLGIGVTIVTTYAKREDIKAFFNGKCVKGDDSQVTPESARVENTVREASALPSAISPLPSKIPQPKRGIRTMD
ncbi:hypothetical protein ACROYT_G033249 [Oculina patagonica]